MAASRDNAFRLLLDRARAGDAGAQHTLVQRFSGQLLDRIRWMMGDPARRQAESGDFLQEAFLYFFRTLDRVEIENEQHFLRWLARVARNSIRDEVRRPHESALERLGCDSGLLLGNWSAETPSAQAQRAEVRERVADVLRALPQEYQRAIELRNLEQRSFAQIGALLNKSENAAQLLHTRAMARLGRLLAATSA